MAETKSTLNAVIEYIVKPFRSEKAIGGLDEVRGIAVLFVLFAHSKFADAGFGATGVWLFYVMSGFLLAPSFFKKIQLDTTIKSASTETVAYILSRLFRILPAYYVAVAFYCFLIWVRPNSGSNFNMDLFIAHVTFEQAIWLFWSIKTEVIFYLGVPIAALIVAFAGKASILRILIVAALTALIYFFTEVDPLFKINLMAVNQKTFLYATPFCLGVLLAMINPKLPEPVRLVAFLVGFALMLLLSMDHPAIMALREMIGLDGKRLPWTNRLILYFVCAFAVAGALGSNIVLRFLAPLRWLGVVSFSFYLYHTLFLVLLRRAGVADGWELAAYALPLTVLAALASFYIIETPAHMLGRFVRKKISQI